MRKAVTYGLFAAWALHDLEEIAGTAYWSQRVVPKLRRRYPSVPDRAWSTISVDRVGMAKAVGLMAVAVAAATVEGERTGGRSRLFQAAVAGFGLHGLSHLAGSALARDYTPGVLTAPVLVIPYALCARRALGRAGAWRPMSPADTAVSLLVVAALIGAAQGGARLLDRRRTAAGRAQNR
jgi:Protein of unknown function with HXXEE motif